LAAGVDLINQNVSDKWNISVCSTNNYPPRPREAPFFINIYIFWLIGELAAFYIYSKLQAARVRRELKKNGTAGNFFFFLRRAAEFFFFFFFSSSFLQSIYRTAITQAEL